MFNLPQELLKQFYSAIIESVLCTLITVWFSYQIWSQKTMLDCWANHWYNNPPQSPLSGTVLIQSEQKGWQNHSGPLTSSTLPLWTVAIWLTLQSTEHQNSQAQEQFLPSGNSTYEHLTIVGSRGLMDSALDFKPEVTQGCGFECRLRQEVHDCSPGTAQSAAHCSKCVQVKCRKHISLLIILCIIVYVTIKAHLSLICIVLYNKRGTHNTIIHLFI